MRNYCSITLKTHLPCHKYTIEHTLIETYVCTHTQASNHRICIKSKMLSDTHTHTRVLYSKMYFISYDSKSHLVQSSTSITYFLP